MRWMSLSGVLAGAIALSLLGGSALAGTPAPKQQDVAAARAVTAAITRFDQTAVRREGAMTAAAKAEVAQVQAGCAGGIPASVVNGTSHQQAVAFDLLFEGVVDLSLDVLHPVHHAGLSLARAFHHAQFTKASFTRGIHSIAKREHALLTLPASDLCTDVKAAAANGFTADPPGTTASLEGFSGVLLTSAKGIPDVLKKIRAYLVTKADRAALKRLQRIDSRYQGFSEKLGSTYGGKLATVLTAAPPPAGGFPTNPPPRPSSTQTALRRARPRQPAPARPARRTRSPRPRPPVGEGSSR